MLALTYKHYSINNVPNMHTLTASIFVYMHIFFTCMILTNE